MVPLNLKLSSDCGLCSWPPLLESGRLLTFLFGTLHVFTTNLSHLLTLNCTGPLCYSPVEMLNLTLDLWPKTCVEFVHIQLEMIRTAYGVRYALIGVTEFVWTCLKLTTSTGPPSVMAGSVSPRCEREGLTFHDACNLPDSFTWSHAFTCMATVPEPQTHSHLTKIFQC